MQSELAELNAQRLHLQDFFGALTAFLTDCAPIVKGETGEAEDHGDLADFGWCLDQIEKVADDLRKEAKKRKEIISRRLAMEIVRNSLNDDDLKARGKLCTASPKANPEPILPRKDDPKYRELLIAMGVPESMVDTGMLQPHWKHIQTWLANLAEIGEEPPIAIESRPHWRCIFYSKRQPKDKAE